jgi:hypothetical protein
MQWLTPTRGLFHRSASMRATTATATKGAPIPGPGMCADVQGHVSSCLGP